MLGVKSWDNVRALKVVLFLFEAVSVLKKNFHKSILKTRGCMRRPLFCLAKLGGYRLFIWAFLLVVMLGVCCFGNRLLIALRLDYLNGRVDFCLCGHLIFLKSVLFSLPVYTLFFFRAPSCIISSLESILNCFFGVGVRIIGKLLGLTGILFV